LRSDAGRDHHEAHEAAAAPAMLGPGGGDGGEEAQSEAAQSVLLRTIADLMEQAKLPMPGQQAALMDELLTMRSRMRQLEARVSSREEATHVLQQRLEEAEKERTCSICLQGSVEGVVVDTVCLPCGHVYCGECARRLEQCARCKKAIASRHRIFK
jgi:hypothetical protein